MTNNIEIILVFVAVLLIVLYYNLTYKKEGYPQYSTAFETVGNPPPLGDYLPTVGDVPTGDDDQVIMSGMYSDQGVSHMEATLCEECIDKCIGQNYTNGTYTVNTDRDCRNKCNLVCSPTFGI